MTPQSSLVHVIDDDRSWRISVARLLSAAGFRVALYETAEAFLASKSFDGLGCILLDLRMPGLTGLQLQQHLAATRRQLPIIFLSGHGDILSSVQAMKSGAEDFLTKPVDTAVLLDTVARALDRAALSHERREQQEAMQSRVDALTPAERRVFALVVRGMLNKRIAAELGVAERTVKWHRQHIMQKLQIESVAEMVSLAERLGLLEDLGHRNADSN